MFTNPAQRLAEMVKARRAQLDLSQLDVWQSGGPSNTTLTVIENGKLEALTSSTAKKLDAGLRWERGSARSVWEGGEPTPLASAVASIEDLRRRILAAPYLTDQQKADAIAAITPREGVGGHGSSAAM